MSAKLLRWVHAVLMLEWVFIILLATPQYGGYRCSYPSSVPLEPLPQMLPRQVELCGSSPWFLRNFLGGTQVKRVCIDDYLIFKCLPSLQKNFRLCQTQCRQANHSPPYYSPRKLQKHPHCTQTYQLQETHRILGLPIPQEGCHRHH